MIMMESQVLMIADSAPTSRSDPATGVSTCKAMTLLARSGLGSSGKSARIPSPAIIAALPINAWKTKAIPIASRTVGTSRIA